LYKLNKNFIGISEVKNSRLNYKWKKVLSNYQ